MTPEERREAVARARDFRAAWTTNGLPPRVDDNAPASFGYAIAADVLSLAAALSAVEQERDEAVRECGELSVQMQREYAILDLAASVSGADAPEFPEGFEWSEKEGRPVYSPQRGDASGEDGEADVLAGQPTESTDAPQCRCQWGASGAHVPGCPGVSGADATEEQG